MRAGLLPARLEKKTNCNAIRVKHANEAHGKLCKLSDKCPPYRTTVSFYEILKAFDFVLHEASFLLGEFEVKRRTGYPMGGSFSEPATLIDLQDDVLQFHHNKSTALHCAWHHPDLSPEETVMGCQHVDDALIGSTILCLSCLESGLKKLWPSDVGVSVEETGNKLRFLQAEIVIPNPKLKEYILTPYNPNIDFAKGLSEHQHTARLGKYRNL